MFLLLVTASVFHSPEAARPQCCESSCHWVNSTSPSQSPTPHSHPIPTHPPSASQSFHHQIPLRTGHRKVEDPVPELEERSEGNRVRKRTQDGMRARCSSSALGGLFQMPLSLPVFNLPLWVTVGLGFLSLPPGLGCTCGPASLRMWDHHAVAGPDLPAFHPRPQGAGTVILGT